LSGYSAGVWSGEDAGLSRLSCASYLGRPLSRPEGSAVPDLNRKFTCSPQPSRNRTGLHRAPLLAKLIAPKFRYRLGTRATVICISESAISRNAPAAIVATVERLELAAVKPPAPSIRG
jgi:hypothetical protein